MALSYWCVLLACVMPILAAGTAKWGSFSRSVNEGGYDNSEPRAWLARQSGRRARANAAQSNSFEALPLFVAAVLTAQQLQVNQSVIDVLAVAFVLLRVAYIVLYVRNLSSARTAVWSAAFGVCVALFLSPLWT